MFIAHTSRKLSVINKRMNISFIFAKMIDIFRKM